MNRPPRRTKARCLNKHTSKANGVFTSRGYLYQILIFPQKFSLVSFVSIYVTGYVESWPPLSWKNTKKSWLPTVILTFFLQIIPLVPGHCTPKRHTWGWGLGVTSWPRGGQESACGEVVFKVATFGETQENSLGVLFFPVQFSCSVVSNSLQTHGPQHTRPPCPSPTPRAYSNSCPLSLWCHPAISSSVVPFSSLLQPFPASGSFQMSQFFTSGGQSIGTPASASVLPVNIQDWFPFRFNGWISLQSKGVSVFSNTTVQKHQFFDTQLSFMVQLTYPHMTMGKTIALTK